MPTVKTAISLPEPLFNRAESVAHELQISRSQLVAKAVDEFVKRYERQALIEAINRPTRRTRRPPRRRSCCGASAGSSGSWWSPSVDPAGRRLLVRFREALGVGPWVSPTLLGDAKRCLQ